MGKHEKRKAGELIYSDVCGPFKTESVSGAKYFVLFKDDCTSYRMVYFIKHKSDVVECFKKFYNLVKNQFGYTIKVLHTDGGTEYVNQLYRHSYQTKA